VSTTEVSPGGTRVITDGEFVAAVERVLKKRGASYIYEVPAWTQRCVYSADEGETGSCLFGAVLLDEFGIPYSDAWEGATIAQVLRGQSDIGPITVDGVEFLLSEPVITAAMEGQSTQDNGQRYDDVEDDFFGNLLLEQGVEVTS
jgi:hypothetical protein